MSQEIFTVFSIAVITVSSTMMFLSMRLNASLAQTEQSEAEAQAQEVRLYAEWQAYKTQKPKARKDKVSQEGRYINKI